MKLLDWTSKKIQNYMLRKIKEETEKMEQDKIKFDKWIKDRKEKERRRVEIGKPLYRYETYHFKDHRYYRVHPDTSTSYSDRPYLIHDPDCPKCSENLKSTILNVVNDLISDFASDDDSSTELVDTRGQEAEPEVDDSKENLDG